jgi:hypothetical protein
MHLELFIIGGFHCLVVVAGKGNAAGGDVVCLAARGLIGQLGVIRVHLHSGAAGVAVSCTVMG